MSVRAALPLLFCVACDAEDLATVYTDARLATDIEGYEDWAHPAAWPGIEPSCADDHGDFVQIWLNKIAVEDIAAGRTEFSEGAVFVSESYQDSHGTPKIMAAMRKVPDFAPDFGDWYWGQYDEAGTLVDGGSMPVCASCHEEGTDFVRHTAITPPATEADCPRDDDTGVFPTE